MNPSISLRVRRVLIFSLAYTPFVGGAELAVREVTDRMPRDAYTFDMITLRFDSALPRVERIGNVTVHRIGWCAKGAKISDRSMPFVCKLSKVMFPMTAYLKALSLHRAHRYDLMWALLANQAGFAALFFKLTHPRIPYVLELQDGNSLSQIRVRQPLLRFIWPLYRQVYLKANAIKVISRFIERLAREVGYTGRIELIPNGVDLSEFASPIPQERLNELKARFDKRMGDIFLFTASRLVLSRGVEDIIRALPHLPIEVKLLIAGDGEDRDKLERIARDERVEGRVLFAGQIEHDALPAYFQLSDIFVRPSLIEGQGSAFIEAFAAGIPVVATPVGGIPDFLTDGETGVFCKVSDPRSVADAVRRYLEDPTLVARVVGQAKALASERYEWERIARAVDGRVLVPLLRG